MRWLSSCRKSATFPCESGLPLPSSSHTLGKSGEIRQTFDCRPSKSMTRGSSRRFLRKINPQTSRVGTLNKIRSAPFVQLAQRLADKFRKSRQRSAKSLHVVAIGSLHWSLAGQKQRKSSLFWASCLRTASFSESRFTLMRLFLFRQCLNRFGHLCQLLFDFLQLFLNRRRLSGCRPGHWLKPC